MLGTNYIGTIAQQRDGAYEFIPHRAGPFCTALRLPAGTLGAKSAAAIQRLVRGLL